MKKNLGTSDRILRFSASFLFFILSIWLNSWILFAVAVFIFFEAITSWCILYQIIGKNTCPISKKSDIDKTHR